MKIESIMVNGKKIQNLEDLSGDDPRLHQLLIELRDERNWSENMAMTVHFMLIDGTLWRTHFQIHCPGLLPTDVVVIDQDYPPPRISEILTEIICAYRDTRTVLNDTIRKLEDARETCKLSKQSVTVG